MQKSTSSRFSRTLYAGYLLILCWAPLPLASNRDWSLGLLIAMILLLAMGMLVEILLNDLRPWNVLKSYRVPLGLFIVVATWITCQCIPLDSNWIEMLSPVTAQSWSLVEGSGDMYPISLDPDSTMVSALFTWCLLLFSTATLLLHDSAQRVRTTCMVIVYCGLFQALYGSFMTLSGLEYSFFMEKEFYRGVATGTFVNRNSQAGYLGMCLAVGIGLLVANLSGSSVRGWRNHLKGLLDTMLGAKLRLRIYLALMVIALVLTRSRMGNTAFFTSLAICGITLMIMQRKLHKGAIILFASMVLIDFLIVGQWFGFEELAERLESTSTQTELRDELVRDTITLIKDYPVTGIGLGTYYAVFLGYQGPEFTLFFDLAHNDYLQFFAELGLIGFIPLAILVLYSLTIPLIVLHRRRNKLARGLAFGAMMAMVTMGIHATVDFNLQMPANALLFIVLLSFAWLSRQLPRERH